MIIQLAMETNIIKNPAPGVCGIALRNGSIQLVPAE